MASTPPLRSAIQQDEALWVAHFTKLFRQCHEGTGGRGLDDPDYLATIATGEVERVPQASRPDVSHFEHTPARQAFIAEIYQRHLRAYFSETYDAELFTRDGSTWAFLQVADMNKIAAWNREISEDKEAIPGILSQVEAIAQTIALQFKFFFPAHRTKKEKATMPLEETVTTEVSRKCLKRDRMQCVVTGQRPGEAFSIYPASLGSPDIFNALVGLWDEKRARRAAIRTLISGPLYKVSNTICLCPSLRDAWLRGEFALKPLSQGWDAEEKKHSLKIALYWMRKSTPSPCYYHLSAHDYLMTDDQTPRYTTRAVNIYTGARVWDIIRMASLCAGAEPTEIDHEDFDDDSEDGSEEDPEEGSEEDEEDSDVEDQDRPRTVVLGSNANPECSTSGGEAHPGVKFCGTWKLA